MRPRTLAILFLVVAGLLAFIWFYERELPSSDERAELANRVVRLEADEVEAVVLELGDRRVRLERRAPAPAETGGEAAGERGWRLSEPLDAPADGAAVDRLVDTLTALEKKRTLAGADPDELGLSEPRGRVVVERAAGTVELVVGSEVPASATLILAVAGRDEAYVVADDLWDDLVKPAGDWRSRELGPRSRDEIQRLALVSGDRRVALGRRGESFWVEAPYVDRADRDLVSALLGEITGLRVESFVDDPGEPRPEGPEGVVEVVLEGREEALRIELEPAAEEAGELRRLRVDGQLVDSRTDLATALGRQPEQWRSRAWSSFEVYQIDRLEVRDAAGETVFERDAGDWLRDGARVDYSPVSELLYALTGIEAEGVTESPAPAGEPRLTLELSDAGAERRETLTLYPPAAGGGASPARVSGREVTLLVGEGAVADLEVKLAAARRAEEPAAEDASLEALGED